MWQRLKEWWQEANREPEYLEYYKYLRRYSERLEGSRGKTKAELAQELHDWKMRSSNQAQSLDMVSKLTHVQADEITRMRGQLYLQELLLKSMLEEVNYYKLEVKPHDLPNSKLCQSTTECRDS